MKNLTQIANEQIQVMESRRRDETAGGKRAIAIVLSALATLVYFGLMAYAETSPLDKITTPAVRVVLGVLIGVFAIVGGEYAIGIWHERLHHDKRINSSQRKTARAGLMLASVAAGLSTVSMMVYLFPVLVNGVLQSAHVAGVNLVMLTVSLVGYFVLDGRYGAESDAAENNRKIASANNLMASSEAAVIATVAAGRSSRATELANMVDYREDGLRILSDHLNRPVTEIERLLPAPATPAGADPEPDPVDWQRLVADMGLTEDDLRVAVAYGRSLRDADGLTADDLQLAIDQDRRRDEAERLARIANRMPASSGELSPELQAFLRKTGRTADQVRNLARSFGLTDPDKAYRKLQQYGQLPDGMTRSEFDALFDELMHGAPRPTERLASNGNGRH